MAEGDVEMTDLVGTLLGRIKEKVKRVLVIGDVMIDRWIHGRITPCQDGCPKFVQESILDTPGGAANAERCLSNWGVNTSLYGQVREDRPIKTRYVTDGGIVFRADNDVKMASVYRWAQREALETVKCAGAVLLSDYDKGFLAPEFIAQVTESCKLLGVPCIADCKRAPEVYEGCILKGNREWNDKYQHPSKWNECVSCSWVLTLGGEQCVVNPSGKYDDTHLCGVTGSVKCVNHVGAGDCFAAHLALCLAYGFSIKEAAVLAHSAGRVYVQHPHNYPPTPAEIAADLSSVT